MVGETSGDGGDAANVMNPNPANGDATVEVRLDPEGYIDVVRANELVERMITTDEDGCHQATGQIGQVSICNGSATPSLTGRPQLSCPDKSGGAFGPCNQS